MDKPTRIQKLKNELQIWLRGDPVPGFVARPAQNEDGSINFLEWECVIPGKVNTFWEGGVYRLRLIFDEEYPIKPPKCLFNPVLFHPNILDCGLAILPPIIFNWKPENTIKTILFSFQEFLDRPTYTDDCCVNMDAFKLYEQNRTQYDKLIQEQALRTYLRSLPLYGEYYQH
ncbi:SUMO-conjugating enzyme UBC9-B-like [Sipha flava]|uniref:SUMO-conjugating enzyme UBC9 n=1 Tax=Sipha flava TaxID=143950 RepID=A0A2S2QTX0_9HEMI|nr:SUMO-conjugating enzyme UBC9-B-like [Sipha flava]